MKKYNDKSPCFKDWTKKKLVQEYIGTDQSVHEVACYGCSDLRYLDGLEKEINRRGYKISTRIEIS